MLGKGLNAVRPLQSGLENNTAVHPLKQHNSRAGKKKSVRGELQSRQLFDRSLAQSSLISAKLIPSSGSVITPCTIKQRDTMNHLKRKVKEFETKEVKWNDRVIELEVAVQQKDAVINKHIKQIRLLNKSNSNNKKACNLVVQSLMCGQLILLMSC
jgi:hypothetical protein